MFFATCARLLPNDVRVTVEQQLALDRIYIKDGMIRSRLARRKS